MLVCKIPSLGQCRSSSRYLYLECVGKDNNTTADWTSHEEGEPECKRDCDPNDKCSCGSELLLCHPECHMCVARDFQACGPGGKCGGAALEAGVTSCEAAPGSNQPLCLPQCKVPPHTRIREVIGVDGAVTYAKAYCDFHHDFLIAVSIFFYSYCTEHFDISLMLQRDTRHFFTSEFINVHCERHVCPMTWVYEVDDNVVPIPRCSFNPHFCSTSSLEAIANARANLSPGVLSRKDHSGYVLHVNI